jgi:hypothetical protein
VLIGKEVATVTVSSVTCDGVAMTAITSGATFGNQGVWAYWIHKPTGTTTDIAVTWSGAATSAQEHIAVYAITDAVFPPLVSGTNTSTDMDAGTPLTTGSQTIPTNGGALAIASCANDATTKTWANITSDLDTDAGDFRFSTAKRTTSGTVTMTCTGSTNQEDGALLYMIFAQQALPAVSMQTMRAA